MRFVGPLAIALGSTWLVACGRPGPAPDFQIRGVGVVLRTDAAFAARQDLPDRIESTLQAALDYWGGDWRDLEGRTITLDGADHVSCRGVPAAIGCYDGDIRVSTSDLGRPFDCAEQTTLVHEVGHAVIGDAAHADPRWMDFQSLALQLAGRTGYQASGEVACPISPSVWRHPPGSG